MRFFTIEIEYDGNEYEGIFITPYEGDLDKLWVDVKNSLEIYNDKLNYDLTYEHFSTIVNQMIGEKDLFNYEYLNNDSIYNIRFCIINMYD